MGEAGGRVLVVDDDSTILDVLTRYFERAGFEVITASDGMSALASAHSNPPDLVVLDLMLPGIDGLDVCRQLRQTSSVPVVMLTALGEVCDRIVGLEVGADDYVCKPFSPRELVLRVQSVLRRTQDRPAPGGATVLRDGELEVDLVAHEARVGSRPLGLTLREYDLLTFLLRNPGQVFSREELMREVWSWSFGDRTTVTVHVRRLREKLGDDRGASARIATVWGCGYRYDQVGSQ